MSDPRRGDYAIVTDPARFDLDLIHGFLTTSYWARGVSPERVVRAMQHSMCFGIFHQPTGAQVGFARVITDRTTFGYIADVFVVEGHRGQGLACWLTEVILAHPELSGFRRWMLATRDAHAVYAAAGFTPLAAPDRLMEFIPKRETP